MSILEEVQPHFDFRIWLVSHPLLLFGWDTKLRQPIPNAGGTLLVDDLSCLCTGLFARVHRQKWAQTHLASAPSKGLFCKETPSVSCWNYFVHSHKQMILFRILPFWPGDKVFGVDNANIICKNIFCLCLFRFLLLYINCPAGTHSEKAANFSGLHWTGSGH